jgi:hypothetical protein
LSVPLTANTLEKSRLRRFFQTAALLPPEKGVTFSGCLVAVPVCGNVNTP